MIYVAAFVINFRLLGNLAEVSEPFQLATQAGKAK
jgi:hypothetical protein